MSNFKIALTAIFAICFVVGIVLFAMYKGGNGQTTSHITVWGTISSEAFDTAYKASSVSKNKYIITKYVQKNTATFEGDFVEALADGVGPDMVILRDDMLYNNRNKLFVIPYQNYSERTFKDQFVEGAEMFLRSDGVSAVPLMIDPMVMYWNRDIFGNALVSQPPKYWDEIYDLINKMTKRDSSANIMKSAVALGEYGNINNAKEIISLVLLQAGTPIVGYDRRSGSYSSVISSQFNGSITPGQSALDFYTQFSNPTSASYTWNRSLPTSLNFFLAGNLAMYMGFASDIFSIQQKNPNLNFDVTDVPQIRGADAKIGFAHIYAMALVKQSKFINASFNVISGLTEPSAQTALEKATNLPPVRRDLLSAKPEDAFRTVFYNSSLISRSWIDPDPAQTATIFRNMIESITSGKARTFEALGAAGESINSLLIK